jgi:hypothetical protein
MSIANVTLSDTFSQWVVKTNQLIVQSGETNTLAVAAFNSANDVSFTAANIAAEILVANSVFNNVIIESVSSSSELADLISSNTLFIAEITDVSNTIVNDTVTSIVLSPEYTNDIANLFVQTESSNLANIILANTIVLNTIYDNSNTLTANIVNSADWINTAVSIVITEGTLADQVLANTEVTNTIYDNANLIAESFNTNSNLGLAWSTANAALANTDSYVLVINNLTITGNLILSGPDAVLDML